MSPPTNLQSFEPAKSLKECMWNVLRLCLSNDVKIDEPPSGNLPGHDLLTKSPGSMFELETILLDGRLQRVYKNSL